MTGAELVRTRLLALSAVTALVSTRVYLFAIPATSLFPAIRVQRISEVQSAHLRGVGAVMQERVQVDAFADTLSAALAIDAAAQGAGNGTALSGFTGTVSGESVLSVRPVAVRENFDPAEQQRYRVSRDYMVTWK